MSRQSCWGSRHGRFESQWILHVYRLLHNQKDDSYLTICFHIHRAGEKHLDSSGSDSELDMPSMGGSNSQNAGKGSHNSNMSSGLQHNILLQQSLGNNQLGEHASHDSFTWLDQGFQFIFWHLTISFRFYLFSGQMSHGYSTSNHNIHSVPPLHPYDMDAYHQPLWF